LPPQVPSFKTIEEYLAAAPELADALYQINLLAGTGKDANGDPVFELERPLNRMESLVLVIRLMGLEEKAQGFTGTNPFTDTPDWGDRFAAFAYSEGITAGVSDTEFASDRLVTFQEFTAFALRVLGYSEKNGDFRYERALNQAYVTGLYSASHVQAVNNAGRYLRAYAVVSMVDALHTNMKGADTRLIDKLAADDVIDQEAADDFIIEVAKVYSRK